MNIGETEIASRVAKGELFMIEPEQMQNRGMKIVNVDSIFDDMISDVVGFPVNDSPLYSTAGEPAGKGTWMMVAAFGEIRMTTNPNISPSWIFLRFVRSAWIGQW